MFASKYVRSVVFIAAVAAIFALQSAAQAKTFGNHRSIRLGGRRRALSVDVIAPPESPAPNNNASSPSPSPQSNQTSTPPPPAPPPLGGNCPDAAAMFNLTNLYRNRHQAVNITWSDSLATSSAAYAQKLANGGCQLIHSGGKDYGENLMMWQAYPKPDNSCVGAIKSWYAEVKNYNFLAQRPFYENWPKNVGHFTQLVWRASTAMGCGVGSADVSMNFGGNKAYPGGCKVVVCRYKVPGNVANDMSFLKNVLRNTSAAVV